MVDGWGQKRFWTEAGVEPEGTGFSVVLDGRRVRTPARAPLTLPTRALAEAIAAEWAAQKERIDPSAMPLTRTANSAIDKVTPQQAEVAALLTDYAGTDLLCYRAASPDELVARQRAGWQPWLDWAETEFGARLVVTTGVLPVAQDPEAIARLGARAQAMDPFRLAAFHDLVALSGSFVLALAVESGALDAAEAWTLSRIDEDWQAELWGADDEAVETAGRKQAAFVDAARFIDALDQTG